MPKIELRNVTKRWGKFYAVDNLSLDIEDNSFVTLLGPSGCGKTTILRMIAGLETPTSGRITIGDRVVFDSEGGINISANERRVGFLFQNYALWPNMTVQQNIAFGLSNVKEEIPTYDFEHKNTTRLIEIIKNPKDVANLINDCKDKKGEIDRDYTCLILIDRYEISMFTAKVLFDFKLHEASDLISVAKSTTDHLIQKAEKINEGHKSKNQVLNSESAVVVNGQVVTKLRKLSKEEIDLSVRDVARIVKIGMFMDRYPAELSGGQQQRVAIARTLAPKPAVLFMDEPLSNLDAKLRLEMRYELQRLHVETGSTFVYVTHDQMEAMTLATQICLVDNGLLQQYAAPLEVYNKPNNLFVGDFVGSPSINFVEAKGRQKEDGNIHLSVLEDTKVIFKPSKPLDLVKWITQRNSEEELDKQEKEKLALDKKFVEKINRDTKFEYHIDKVDEFSFVRQDELTITDEDFVIGIRPEFFKISDEGALEGSIYGAMPTGMESTIKIRIGNFLLTAVIFGNVLYAIGTKIRFDIIGDSIALFDRHSGDYIASGSVEMGDSPSAQ